MKILLCLLLCCILVESFRKRWRDDNCLKRNRYPHESYCRKNRQRVFYAFHRVIPDCVMVTTRCPRMHRHNEYASLTECRDDCWWFIENESITTTTDYSTTTTVAPDKNDNKNDKDKGNED